MKVSIIIPTYNRAKLVCETIDSVLRQTYTDYEIIVVDDGSTDNTEQALHAYLDKIIYIRQDNSGINSARNTALKYAKGEYIALLDSDDLWLDFKLALEVEVLDQYPQIGFVFEDFFIYKTDGSKIPHGIRRWYNENRPWQDYFSKPVEYVTAVSGVSAELKTKVVSLYKGDVYHKSLFGPAVLPSASLYRRSAAKDLIFNEDDSTCGDWEFFAKLSNKSGAIFLDVEAVLNRSHEDAVRLTRVDHKIQIQRMIELIDRIWLKDNTFRDRYLPEIDKVRYAHYNQLIKLQLLESSAKEIRSTIRQADTLSSITSRVKFKIFNLITYIPFSQYLLKVFRKLIRGISDLRQTGLSKVINDAFAYIYWRYNRIKEEKFDTQFGVETSKIDERYMDKVDSVNKQYAIPYEPIQFEVFNKMMSEISVAAENYVFIDLGSGKARSLMYAARLPYKRLIGVEFSGELHDIAQKNIEAFLHEENLKRKFELICGDATTYTLPKENIVLFMYNPFVGEAMQAVVNNIVTFIQNEPYDLVVLYRNPVCAEMFNKQDGLILLTENASYNIYKKR